MSEGRDILSGDDMRDISTKENDAGTREGLTDLLAQYSLGKEDRQF